MIKGFIDYNDVSIPFVIEDYRMELFTDSEILHKFIKEHNFKNNFILSGRSFSTGSTSTRITLLVEKAIGSTCYLTCYIIDNIVSTGKFDSIGFQSRFLDSIFRYKYNYMDHSRAGTNLAASQIDIYNIPFKAKEKDFQLTYRIGQRQRMGLLEDFEMWGETIVSLHDADIAECYRLAQLIERFAKFMSSNATITFKCIKLYCQGMLSGHFYYRHVSEDTWGDFDIRFYQFDVMKYSPKIIENLALDLGNKISKSIPLGHLQDSSFTNSPQRFIEQITAFEYLFEKLEPNKAKSDNYPLKRELALMFKKYPYINNGKKLSANQLSNRIKKLRVEILHGQAYYYDFNSNHDIHYLVYKLDDLIQAMSLKLVGFTQEEIQVFQKHIL